MKKSHRIVHDLIASLVPHDLRESEHIDFVLRWIESGSSLYRLIPPATPPIHLVVYSVIYDAESNKILLTDHKKSGLWLPPGGHVEPDEDPAAAVKRELVEELGTPLDFYRETPLFLTVTEAIRVSPHTDVSLWYLLKGSEETLFHYCEEEFHQVRWFSLEELPYERADPHLRRFIDKLNKQLTLESYDAKAQQYAEMTQQLHPQGEGETFMALLPPGGKIIDIGCGPGRDLKVFEEHGFDVTGIDFSPKMIELAKAAMPRAALFVTDIEKLDFDEGSFDGVWASSSLLHLKREQFPEILKKIYRLLTEGGIFFLSLKKGNSEGLAPDSRYEGSQKFWSYYEEEELFLFLKEAGFQILESVIVNKRSSYQTHPFINIFCKK